VPRPPTVLGAERPGARGLVSNGPNVTRSTMNEETRGVAPFRVVVNHEEQYALWFVERELPPGWSDAGKRGTREECLAYVEQVWTDMRPLSLRERAADPA
jgi:MbtH protein